MGGKGDNRSQSGSAAPPHVPPQASEEDLKAAFHMGVNVKTTVKRTTKQSEGPAPRTLQRKVVNCLKCGKIFDCRKPDGDAVRFLSSGGLCTFCGSHVRLDYSDGTSNIDNDELLQPETSGTQEAIAAAAARESTGDQATAMESEAEAFALKDRLVEYDRTAAKRTNIIDDQSDYFAIDSNAWLTDEERSDLRRQQREVEAAAEDRRRRLVVTVDLLGRRVVMDSEDKEDYSGGGGGGGGRGEADVQATAVAMAATAAEKPQGGGSAVPSGLLLQNQRQQPRVSVCPSMASAGYVFVPQKQKTVRNSAKKEGQKEGQQQKSERNKTPAVVQSGRSSLRAGQPPRLQHDDPFDQAAADLAELVNR